MKYLTFAIFAAVIFVIVVVYKNGRGLADKNEIKKESPSELVRTNSETTDAERLVLAYINAVRSDSDETLSKFITHYPPRKPNAVVPEVRKEDEMSPSDRVRSFSISEEAIEAVGNASLSVENPKYLRGWKFEVSQVSARKKRKNVCLVRVDLLSKNTGRNVSQDYVVFYEKLAGWKIVGVTLSVDKSDWPDPAEACNADDD